MPIQYDELMALKNLGQKYAYSDREVMLYAYGIGMGADPMDEKELAFVNEAAATSRALKVVPTFASVARATEIVDHDGCALAREQFCVGFAKPATRPGDDGHLLVEQSHWFSPLFSFVSRTRCSVKRCFAEPGSIPGKMGPGSAAHHSVLRSIRGTRPSNPAPSCRS